MYTSPASRSSHSHAYFTETVAVRPLRHPSYALRPVAAGTAAFAAFLSGVRWRLDRVVASSLTRWLAAVKRPLGWLRPDQNAPGLVPLGSAPHPEHEASA